MFVVGWLVGFRWWDPPAEQMELLQGDATSGGCGETLVVELVAWGSSQLEDLQLGHGEEGVR